MIKRWRVERAGSHTSGYGLGWIAMNSDGTGAWFRTWAEAMTFACDRALLDSISDSWRWSFEARHRA